MISVLSRRRLLQAPLGVAAVAATTPWLVACPPQPPIACPTGPSQVADIDWTPDVMRPVFYGRRDYTTADGAPTPLRIWYPTYEGFIDGAPILNRCPWRWPLVLFLHGWPPCSLAGYHQRWFWLPAILARSGYVVAVPSHGAQLPAGDFAPQVAEAAAVIDWVRGDWEHALLVDEGREAVAGHSYGALLAARVAAARPTTAAYVGLSAPWSELGGAGAAMQAIDAPSMYMWARFADASDFGVIFEDLDEQRLWTGAPAPKYGVAFAGEHFDYIMATASCANPKGDCAQIGPASGDLAALFLARFMRPDGSTTSIPAGLVPPTVSLTQEQQFFVGGRLGGLSSAAANPDCSIELRWVDGSGSGARSIA